MQVIMLVFATVLVASWPAPSAAQFAGCDGDFNGDAQVTVDEILVSVNNALNGCPPPGERFVDNGDGTVSDDRTGLVWEKKSDDGSIHDQDNTYTWSRSAANEPDGTAFTSFLATLNRPPCFAGRCDWRLPTVAELQSLVDYGRWSPAIDPVFDTDCLPLCTVSACGCTNLEDYWSSTTFAELPQGAWTVNFIWGEVRSFEKTLPLYARAVRGGG